MNEIKFMQADKGESVFAIEENGERIAEMAVGISGKEMSVYHTEVAEKLEGQGIGKKLIDAMADYARTHELKVIPLCAYVHAQFRRHPAEYADIWKKDKTQV
ncbi:MAG: GNAT family N-acetyltransferase [Segetibacter sp.]